MTTAEGSLFQISDHSVTEEVMSGSCHTVSLLEFELVTSSLTADISWQHILIYGTVSAHILVVLSHVTQGLSIAKAWYVHLFKSLFIRQLPEGGYQLCTPSMSFLSLFNLGAQATLLTSR